MSWILVRHATGVISSSERHSSVYPSHWQLLCYFKPFFLFTFQSDSVQYFLDNLERISKIVSCSFRHVIIVILTYDLSEAFFQSTLRIVITSYLILIILTFPKTKYCISRTLTPQTRIFCMPGKPPRGFQSLLSILTKFLSDSSMLVDSDLKGRNGSNVLILLHQFSS